MTEEEANQRLKAMVPVAVRQPGCDWVHFNNGSRDDLAAAVDLDNDAGQMALARSLAFLKDVFGK